MGGRATKELSEAQSTVKRLTTDLQKAMKDLEVNRSSATKATELQNQVSYLTTSLLSAKRDLEQNTGQLRLAEAEKIAARKLRIQLDSVKSELEKKQAEAFQAQQERKEHEEKNLQLLQQAGKLLQKDQDPTLGVLLADMGHKRIYRADPITLLAHTQARAEKIALSKLKSPVTGWPGTIIAAHLSEADKTKDQEGAIVIIDGQHRLGACSYLEAKGQMSESLRMVTVEVYPEMKESLIKELFMEINKCEPVLDVDLPDGGASEDAQEVLNGAAELLRDAFPKMFKESHNCKRPNMNVDKLRDQLHKADLMGRLDIKSKEDLFKWLFETNSKLGEKSDSDWSAILT